MKIILTLLLNLLSISLFAQTDTSLPLYKQFPDLPPISVYRYPDSLKVTKPMLAGKVKTMVMVFSPDCDHCQHATEDLLRNMEQFKKVQILMVTFANFGMIKPFYDVYHLGRYPNILVGYDPAYMLGTFYNVKNFPAIFLYDKKGKLITGFEGNKPFAEIARALD